MVIDDEIELNASISVDPSEVQMFCDKHTSRDSRTCAGLSGEHHGKKIELAQRILRGEGGQSRPRSFASSDIQPRTRGNDMAPRPTKKTLRGRIGRRDHLFFGPF